MEKELGVWNKIELWWLMQLIFFIDIKLCDPLILY